MFDKKLQWPAYWDTFRVKLYICELFVKSLNEEPTESEGP